MHSTRLFSLTAFLLLGLLWLPSSVAGEQVQVLGFTMGQTTLQEVRQSTQGIRDAGTNAYSHGPMLSTRSHLGIDGVKETLFIFDTDQRLLGVMMTLNKSKPRFDALFNALNSQYRLVNSQRPFVGNQLAEFRRGDVLITLDSPHLSFDMTLLYVRDALNQAFQESQQRQQQEQRERERSRL